MTQATVSVLIIEDESGISLALYKSLNRAGYKAVVAKSGASGLRKAAARRFDIVLLDLGLPDMNGLTVCRQLRKDGLLAPIIILTAEDGVNTKVSLFDAGANDYLTKPFSVDELQARIRSALRPLSKEPEQTQVQVGDLCLSRSNRSVERQGTTIALRRKEFAILEYMMLRPGIVVTRASLMHYAWDTELEGWTNTIDVHIKHLRDKLDRPFRSNLIKTVHGVGYKLDISNDGSK